MVKKIITKAKIISKEILNCLTNILTPLCSVLAAIFTLIPACSQVAKFFKQAEQFLYQACDTTKDIDDYLEDYLKKEDTK